uniref:Prion protein b n=1 Tax=Neogobius melanostomus TaxID=47308 RepID=A0A8C6STH6_9GOBI
MMGGLRDAILIGLLIMGLLYVDVTLAKKGGSFGGGKKTSSTNRFGSPKPSNPQPANYPRQPKTPNRNPNPYPAGGSYPGAGNTNPRQNPGGYPAGGGYPNQPGRANNPNQNPAGGYPAGGGYPNQPGRANNPNQNPAGGYPAGGGYPNQPGRANNPNQNPAGGYPAAGGYPNQPGRGNYPNQYPAGGYPAGGYPAAGGYPVRGGNTGQGWGAPGSYPGGYPGGGGGGYPNWNPNNKILSPRYGAGSYGGQGMGGSPFARSAMNQGYMPKVESKGFAKKAMLAAGVGAMAGMAVGYGLGRFPRPNFNFRNPEEENSYNNYMYRRYGTKSTDETDYGRDYEFKPPPRAESYDKYMENCMNKTDILKDKSEMDEEDKDTVSIEEIGYPSLVEQMKARRCVEEYMVYSVKFLQKRSEAQIHNKGSLLCISQLFMSVLILLSSMLLLQ